MKYTRSLVTTIAALCVMLAVTVFSSLGQRLGWCEENKEYTPEELACIDSGLEPDCSIPFGGPGTWKGSTGSRTGMDPRGEPNTQFRERRKDPARSKIEIHE